MSPTAFCKHFHNPTPFPLPIFKIALQWCFHTFKKQKAVWLECETSGVSEVWFIKVLSGNKKGEQTFLGQSTAGILLVWKMQARTWLIRCSGVVNNVLVAALQMQQMKGFIYCPTARDCGARTKRVWILRWIHRLVKIFAEWTHSLSHFWSPKKKNNKATELVFPSRRM